ncbi:MAG: DNA repair protein RecO [Kangiellaceae bacterium]|jgi:DNA repair protein RecO (recombination protein O)|nr:DNA repair protein RecO [Kangiellaceae bacterium]
MPIVVDRFVVLHTRPYQESSLIIDAFAEKHGRLSFIAKGIKNPKKSHLRAHLQMTAELEAPVSSRGNLKSLNQFEVVTPPSVFVGERFAVANYVSELCLRGLQPNEVQTDLYATVKTTFAGLADAQAIEPLLRKFESVLIIAMGIMPNYQTDADGNKVVAENFYQLFNNEAFKLVDKQSLELAGQRIFSGHCLQNMLTVENLTKSDLTDLKFLNRRLLMSIIGSKPLQSRRLWHEWKNNAQQH